MKDQFGLNLFTLSFTGTIVMTIITTWGLNEQRRAVSENQELKAKSLSVIVFLILIGVSVTQIAYANYENNDFTIFFNALVRGIGYIAIVIAVWKVKKFNKKEVVALIVTILISLASVVSSRPDYWFIGLSAIAVIISFDQPFQIFKEKSSGVVSIKLFITLFISTTFWTLYAFVADIWVLKIISPSYLAIVTLTIALWWKYRDKEQKIL